MLPRFLIGIAAITIGICMLYITDGREPEVHFSESRLQIVEKVRLY